MNKNTSSVQSLESSNSSSINSYFATSYSEKENLQNFLNNLISLEGQVVSTNQTITCTDYYLTDSFPLDITMKQESITTKYYTNDNAPLIKEEGEIGILDAEDFQSEHYLLQKSQDEQYLYQIIDYDKSNDELIIYQRSQTDNLFFNIGFPYSEYENIMFMIQNYDNKLYSFNYQNLNKYILDGIWDYSYEVIFYESENSSITNMIKEAHRYTNQLVIEDGIIRSSTQDVSHEFYYGGIKANWSEYHIIRSYNQGQIQLYTGTLLNPNDYK